MRKDIAKRLVVLSLAMAMGVAGFGATASAKAVKTAKVKATHTVRVKTAKTVRTKTKAVKGHKRTLPGKVTAVSGSTITMSKGNGSYTIDASGVTPVDRKGTAITISDIKVGHKISVRGTVTGTTVTNILKLRDITLPVDTTSTTTNN